MPYKAWDGVEGLSDFGSFGGYCTHSSVLFLTWHRPYLALYEVMSLCRFETLARGQGFNSH
jgi:tyrosinase